MGGGTVLQQCWWRPCLRAGVIEASDPPQNWTWEIQGHEKRKNEKCEGIKEKQHGPGLRVSAYLVPRMPSVHSDAIALFLGLNYPFYIRCLKCVSYFIKSNLSVQRISRITNEFWMPRFLCYLHYEMSIMFDHGTLGRIHPPKSRRNNVLLCWAHSDIDLIPFSEKTFLS